MITHLSAEKEDLLPETENQMFAISLCFGYLLFLPF